MTEQEPPPAAETTTDPPTHVPATRRRKRARGYQRSGFYTLKATLRALGPRVIDKRTALGKQLAEWRDALVRDLGGADALSTQRHALVDVVIRQKLLLESIDAWLLVQPSLVNARKRALLPVVRERQALADGLVRTMVQLGLERRTKPLPSLAEYLAAKEREKASTASP